MSAQEINIDVIAASIALPDELPVVRVADEYSQTPTAVAKVNTDIKVNWANAVAEAGTPLPVTDMVVFQFRNALRWLIIYDNNPSHTAYTYNWVIAANLATAVTTGTGQLKYHQMFGATADPANTYSPHGSFQFAGAAFGEGYIWIDATVTRTAVVTITFTVAPAAINQWTFTLLRWIGGTYVETVAALNTTATTITFTLTVAGYYALRWNGVPGASSRTFSVKHTTGAPTWRQISMPDVLDNIAKVQALAVLASSVEWRNTASYDNAAGSIGGVNIGPALEWWRVAIGPNGYTGISTALSNGWKSFFAARGIYGFLRPKDADDIKMIFVGSPPTVPSAGAVPAAARFDLQEASPYKVYVASCADPNGCDTVVRAATHIQYETNDSWADVRPAQAGLDVWSTACKKLAYADDIVDDINHIRETMRRILPRSLALQLHSEEDERRNVDPRQESDSRYTVV